jgi:hypothetical protein
MVMNTSPWQLDTQAMNPGFPGDAMSFRENGLQNRLRA